MGNFCCYQANQLVISRPSYLAEDKKIKLIGFSLNSETYAMQLMLRRMNVPYEY